jgi:hypothetical protein
MTESYERPDWQRELQAFTERNAGRSTALEIDAADLGAQHEERDFPLRGISYDPRDGRIAIMLGEQASVERRLTHAIGDARSIELLRDEAGRDRVLRIGQDSGYTLLRLL